MDLGHWGSRGLTDLRPVGARMKFAINLNVGNRRHVEPWLYERSPRDQHLIPLAVLPRAQRHPERQETGIAHNLNTSEEPCALSEAESAGRIGHCLISGAVARFILDVGAVAQHALYGDAGKRLTVLGNLPRQFRGCANAVRKRDAAGEGKRQRADGQSPADRRQAAGYGVGGRIHADVLARRAAPIPPGRPPPVRVGDPWIIQSATGRAGGRKVTAP